MSSLIQSANSGNVFNTNPAPLAYGSDVTAGNLLVLCYKLFNNLGVGVVSLDTITDTIGNTWHVVVNQSRSSPDYDEMIFVIAYAVSIASGPNTVNVTVVGAGGISYQFLNVLEFNGVTILDDSNNATGVGTSISSGSANSHSGGVGVTHVQVDDGSGSGDVTLGGGWTDIENTGAGVASWDVAYRVNTSAGSVIANYTKLISGTYLVGIVTFTNPQILTSALGAMGDEYTWGGGDE